MEQQVQHAASAGRQRGSIATRIAGFSRGFRKERVLSFPKPPFAGTLVESGFPAVAGEGAIAQLGERLDRTQEVGGSSPPSSIGRKPCYGGASGVLGVREVVWLGAVGTASGYHIQARVTRGDAACSSPS